MKSTFLNAQSTFSTGSHSDSASSRAMRNSSLVASLQLGLLSFGSSLQHFVMKVAVAVSFQLCLFTARVLLGSRANAPRQVGSTL